MKKVRKRPLRADDLLALAGPSQDNSDSSSGLVKTDPEVKEEPMDTDYLDIDDTCMF